MAVETPRRRTKNPEGRMALREHLAELRRRFVISAVGIILGSIAGWFLSDSVLQHLQQPLTDISAKAGRQATLNSPDVMGFFNLKIKLTVYLGITAASPIWLYQIWAFIMPGLTRKERRYGIGFVAAAVPLFVGGIGLAWLWLPRAVELLTQFTPKGATNFIDAQSYFEFATRLMLAFGIAFVLPLLLVALNFAGVVSGAQLGGAWRVVVFIIFLFAAIVSPSPDPGGMLALALPMVGLYVVAVAIALLNDRRRRRNRENDEIFGLDDDEASPLGPAAEVIPAAEVMPPSEVAPGDPMDDYGRDAT